MRAGNQEKSSNLYDEYSWMFEKKVDNVLCLHEQLGFK